MPAGLTYLLHHDDGTTFTVHINYSDVLPQPGTEIIPGWVTEGEPRVRRADDPYYNGVLIDFDVRVVEKPRVRARRRWRSGGRTGAGQA
jgi:hypothetical protein